VTKQALALPDTQLNPELFLNPRRQSLAVPKVDVHSDIAGFSTHCPVDRLHLFLIQATRPPRMFAILQSN
jgi:hypothetical protein